MTPSSSRKDSLLGRRASFPDLQLLLERIEATYKPVDVLLFGSRARGTARHDSDWDIVVVLPDEADVKLLDPLLGWETQSGSGVHADLHCCFLNEFLADRAVANTQTREIADHALSVAG